MYKNVFLGEYVGHKNTKYIVECGLSKKDDHVISGSEDGCVFMWDLIDATVKEKVCVKKNRTVHSISLHPSEDFMLAACEDKIFFYASTSYESPD